MPQNYSNFLSYNSDAISTTNLKSSLDIVAESNRKNIPVRMNTNVR